MWKVSHDEVEECRGENRTLRDYDAICKYCKGSIRLGDVANSDLKRSVLEKGLHDVDGPSTGMRMRQDLDDGLA